MSLNRHTYNKVIYWFVLSYTTRACAHTLEFCFAEPFENSRYHNTLACIAYITTIPLYLRALSKQCSHLKEKVLCPPESAHLQYIQADSNPSEGHTNSRSSVCRHIFNIWNVLVAFARWGKQSYFFAWEVNQSYQLHKILYHFIYISSFSCMVKAHWRQKESLSSAL